MTIALKINDRFSHGMTIFVLKANRSLVQGGTGEEFARFRARLCCCCGREIEVKSGFSVNRFEKKETKSVLLTIENSPM